MHQKKTTAMNKTHFFYPQNDLALASGQAGFVAPRAAVSLMQSGAALPIWYGKPGDTFIGAVNDNWYRQIQSLFDTRVDVYNDTASAYRPAPWGWSAASRKIMSSYGFNNVQLPDACWIERFKGMSSRVAGAELARALYAVDCNGLTPPAAVVRSTDELKECVERWGTVVAKAPWSCSGRGIVDNNKITTDEFIRRVEGWFGKYGAFTVEPRHDKVMDFAMLFDIDEESTKFIGYSWFITDDHGAYKENILVSDSEIEAQITQYISPRLLKKTITRLLTLIDDFYGDFRIGPIGVDMMIVHAGDGYLLDPYIEVNLRHTMGHVAHRFVESYMAHGKRGRYSVLPAPGGCSQGIIDCTVVDGRITQGTLSLTPPGGAFDIQVSIE